MAKILAEGKTKIIYETEDSPYRVEVFHKDKISKGDGAQIEDMPGKGALVCRASKNIFALLRKKGIPTHYVRPLGQRSYIAKTVDMAPLEFVYRYIGTGSHIKRNPSFPDGSVLKNPEVEIYHKDNRLNDPILAWDEEKGLFNLHIASKPISPETIIGTISLEDLGIKKEDLELMKIYTKQIFQILKEAWETVGITLVDLKCEFGLVKEDGRVVVGDEFSPDNARLWPGGNKAEMIDKDVFRNNTMSPEIAETIGKNYALIAELTETFVKIS